MSEKIMIMPTREPDYISDEDFSRVSKWRIWWDEGILTVNGDLKRTHRLVEKDGKMWLDGYAQEHLGCLCSTFQKAYRRWLDVKVIEGILLK